MSSATSQPSERYVTRRIKDKEGNIIVKRYKKRTSRFNIKIPWVRTPSLFLGSIFALYGYVVNLYRKGNLDRVFNDAWANYLDFFFSSFSGVTALFLTGAVAVGISVFLGWSLLSKGFKIKKWPAAARQLLTIIVISLLVSAVFSSFVNESGITRHQSDQVNAEDDFDLSGLDAPFYSELLDGLLDLIGNIPNPDEIVANITTNSGDFDRLEDTYLWRWLVAETYGDEFDFEKGYEEYEADFQDAQPDTFDDIYPEAFTKQFQVSQQYLTLGSSYSGEAVTPWNSLYDSQMDVSNFNLEATNTEEPVSFSEPDVSRNINSQPVISTSIDQTRTSGRLNYDTFFIEDDKESIAGNSIEYTRLFEDSIQNGWSSERFGPLSQAGTFSSLWGLESLGGQAYIDAANTAFLNQYNTYKTDGETNNKSVYDIILQVSNRIQQEILELAEDEDAADTLNPSSDAATTNEAPEGTDRAYYFWQQVENDALFGIKDAIAGFVNLLRALDIPARPVVGFSVGDVETDRIQLRLEHIHVWIEALVPWEDNGEIRYSWGQFNPIPNFSYLEDGLFVYGINSLGGQAEIEMDGPAELETEIPDNEVAGSNNLILAKMNQNLSLGARVLYENQSAANQNIDLRLLSESEIESLSSGETGLSSFSSIGTDLGEVTTSDEEGNWANFSIFVDIEGNGFMYFGTENRTINTQIQKADLLAPNNERNVYAVVAQFGLSFAFVIVGWQVDATLDLTTSEESVEAVDPGLFNGEAFRSTYALENEFLDFTVSALDADNNPVPDLPIEILVLLPSELDSIKEDPNLIQDQIDDFSIGLTVVTGQDGTADFKLALNDSLRPNSPITVNPDDYFVVVALVQGGIEYKEFTIHVTEDRQIGYEIIPDDDLMINLTETVTWQVNISSLITDSTLEAASGESLQGREMIGYDLIYYIITRDAYDANIDDEDAFKAVLATCTSNLDAVDVDCYILPTNGENDTFGIQDDVTITENYVVTAVFTSGYVPLGSYYLVIFNQAEDIFFVNGTQRFVFSPFALSSAGNLSPLDFNQYNQPGTLWSATASGVQPVLLLPLVILPLVRVKEVIL